MTSLPSIAALALYFGLAFLSPLTAQAQAQDPAPAPAPTTEATPPPATKGTPIDNSGLPPAPRELEPPPPAAPVIAPAPETAGTGALDPEEIQGLIGIPDDAAFSAKLDELKKSGRLNDQTVYELRLLRAWQGEKVDVLKDLATREKLAEIQFNVATSQFFTSQDQIHSFLALMQGLIASRAGDEAALKTNATEAIWLFPEHAQMVGDLIADYRRQKTMANLTLPMDQKLAPSAGGDAIPLADLVKGKKGLLLYFWASWAAPSVEQIPAITQLAERLLPLGVVTAGINCESDAAKAEEQRTQRKITFPWLMEPDNSPLVTLLEIEDVPHSVLISPEGKVLFAGDPEDARLQDALKKIGAGL